MDAPKPELRYVAKNGWPAQPVQPPSGKWQLRVARAFPALIVAIPLVVLSGLNARVHFSLDHFRSPTWILFWILLAGVLLLALFSSFAGVRGAQLEGRERQLGYSTWARKG